jgi:hypothetical protein
VRVRVRRSHGTCVAGKLAPAAMSCRRAIRARTQAHLPIRGYGGTHPQSAHCSNLDRSLQAIARPCALRLNGVRQFDHCRSLPLIPEIFWEIAMFVDKLYVITCNATNDDNQLNLSAKGLAEKFQIKTNGQKKLVSFHVTPDGVVSNRSESGSDNNVGVVGVYFCAHGPWNKVLTPQKVAKLINEQVPEIPQKICFDSCAIKSAALQEFTAEYANLRNFSSKPPTQFCVAAYSKFVSVYHPEKKLDSMGIKESKEQMEALEEATKIADYKYPATPPQIGEKYSVHGKKNIPILMKDHTRVKYSDYSKAEKKGDAAAMRAANLTIRETQKHFARWDGKGGCVVAYSHDGNGNFPWAEGNDLYKHANANR